ncbi:hypothetical protein FB451DRAFT_1396654 [Mycena latifolia]|nr:hypothetical protein FB451DRAFT_1396654 [Mycena latifolia]
MSREPSRPVKAALTVASVLPFVVLQNFHPPCTLWLRFDAAAPKKLKEGSSSEFSPSPSPPWSPPVLNSEELLAHHPPRFDALSKVIGCKPATANSRVSDDHFELKHRRPWSALVPVSSSWDEDSVASPPIARTGLASAAAVPFPGPVDRSIRIPPLTASCPGCDASTCAARGPKWAILRLVVDAGHDVISVSTTIPFYFGRAVEDPQLELNYTLNEFSQGTKFPRNADWYPRARGLGGSTVHPGFIKSRYSPFFNDYLLDSLYFFAFISIELIPFPLTL